MELEIYTKDGKSSGEKITLSPDVFGITPNDHAIYEAVTSYLANQRQGTHKTKTYGEVSGSGKKLWKQKHTGRARIGAARSPLWKGGGTIFGPLPRDYSRRLSKSARVLARKSALSYKASSTSIKIVEDFSLEAPRSKDMENVLKALEVRNKKVLFLVPKTDPVLWKSSRNLTRLQIVEAGRASTYDILNSQVLVMQKSAVAALEQSFQRD